LRGCIGDLHLEKREQPTALGRGPFAFVDDFEARNALALRREPAAVHQVRQQDLTLQLLARARSDHLPHALRRARIVEEGAQPFEQHEHRQFLSRQLFFVPFRHRRIGGQPKSVEAMTGHGEHVRQLSNGRKRYLAEQLDRHSALVA